MLSTHLLVQHTRSSAQIGCSNLTLQAHNNPCMSLILPWLCHSLEDMIWHMLFVIQCVLKTAILYAAIVV